MSKYRLLASSAAALSAALIFTSPGYAQSGDEVVVTATKRDETIFDVPLAVTAVSAAELDKSQVRDISELQNLAPTLTFSRSTGGLQSVFAIRGIGTAGNNTGLEQSVGVVIDGVYRGRPGAALGDYININQVEVLRGPQGTIFGKNTSAGVINVRTAKPSFTPMAKGDLTVGNYNLMQLRGVASGPISENLAVSISGSRQTRDGYITNRVDGSKLNDRDRWSVRGQLLWEPADDISFRLIADHSEAEEKCCVAVPVLYGPSAAAVAGAGGTLVPNTPGTLGGYPGGIADLGGREVFVNPEQPFVDPLDDSGVSLEVEWDLGPVTATTILAHRTFESIPNIDADFTSANIFDSVIGQDLTEDSVEIRFASNGRNTIDWLAGAYLFNQEIDAQNYLGFGADTRTYVGFVTPQVPNPLTPLDTTDTINVVSLLETLNGETAGTYFAAGQASTDQYLYDAGSYALFGNATWHVSDQLDITVGARYTDETKEADYRIDSTGAFSQVALAGPFAGLASLQTAPAVDDFNVKNSDDNLSIAVSAAYEVSDTVNLYARYAQGYKSGGFNLNRNGPNTAPGTSDRTADYATLVVADPSLTPTQSLRNAVTFNPEEIDAYEIGAKTRWFDNRLKLDATLYMQTLSDFQANSFNGTVFTIRNAGELEGKGLELDYVFDATDHWRITGGATFQDVEYTSFTGASNVASSASPTQDLTGEKPNFVSDMILTGAVDYSRAINESYDFLGRLGYRYRTDYTTGQDNDAITVQDDFLMLDALLGFTTEDGKYGLEIWGKNITDETVSTIIFDTPLQRGSFSSFLEAPATYGATLRVNY